MRREAALAWVLDGVHFPAPITRWTAHLFVDVQTAVLRRLSAQHGVLLDGIAFRELHGRVYVSPVPLGGRAREAPPWMVPLLCRTVPSIRRRLQAARRAAEADLPGRIVHEWLDTAEDDLAARGRSLLAVDLDRLDPGGVLAHLDRQLVLAEEGIWWHFRLHAASVSLVGSLGRVLTEEHGWTVPDFLGLFTGLSDATTGPAVGQRAIVALVREAGGVHVLDAATELAQVAAISPGVAAALDGYLELWGQQAVRYEVAYPTVAERPEWLLRRLQQEARAGSDPDVIAERHAHHRAVAEGRLLTSLGDTDDVRHRLARARLAFPVREGNEAATLGIPLAGLRHTGLHLGERLGLERADDAFDLTFAEVRAALRGADAQATRTTAARRRAQREARAHAEAPEVVGPPGAAPLAPPPLAGFPEEAVQQVADALWYAEQVTGRPAVASAGAVLHGLGVSPGQVEGVARVVLDEDDFPRLRPGDVLVCPVTSPVWSIVFADVAALVCDEGGGMSHPALTAREFAIPAVVGTGGATRLVRDGTRVRVDGDEGTVTVLGAQPRRR